MNKALAHAGYVLPEETMHQQSGGDFNFLLTSLSEPINVLIIVGVVFVIGLLFFSANRIPFVIKKISLIQERAKSYHELTSWMLRLSLGIALIGAGVAGAFISPSLTGFPHFSFPQIALG